jgi:uncharacterized protein (DUF58 family)
MTPPSLTLVPPAARQGPGPMPPEVVEALSVGLSRRVASSLPGDQRSAGVGAGTELAQIRPYRVGDDVRQIDPSATARTGEPHVRVHVPERTLTTWIVLDVSASMAFGTANRLKADVAEGVALVLGRLALRSAGSVGLVMFGAGDELRTLPPRGSKPGLVALKGALAAGNVADGNSDPRGLHRALSFLERAAKQPGLVAIVSDFRDQEDWTRKLGALRVRHSVLAVDISDPRERELPSVGRLTVVDPETGDLLQVDTSRRRVREAFAEAERERRDTLRDELRRLRVDHIPLSTDEDWLKQMGRALR